MDHPGLSNGTHADLDQRAEVRNILETLGNLLFLIHLDAEEPERIRGYADEAHERLCALDAALRISGLKTLPVM